MIQNNIIDQAILYATKMHQNQFRKGTKIPYIYHPIEVMQILKENMADQTTIVCGILHDTVEDTPATIEEIELIFGKEVACVIDTESEHKDLPYKERKLEHMQRVKNGCLQAKMVNCADKLSNIKSMYLDYLFVGESLWQRFNGTKQDIQWYYNLALDCLSELSNTKMYQDVKYYFNKLFS